LTDWAWINDFAIRARHQGASVVVVPDVVDVLVLEVAPAGGYRLRQYDAIVGNSWLIALFQEAAHRALIRFCETSETTDWSTAYSAGPCATENPAITVDIALSSKFSTSLMAWAAEAPIEVTQLLTFRCDAVTLRDRSG
jgi:hypothetical protein